MAELIQGTLEDMLPDLLDFASRDIFTESEIKQIIKTRRELEYKLMRPQPLKRHFLSAVHYELTLEDQRVRRRNELGINKPSNSDRSILRRVINLFNRFTAIYPYDVSIWKEYINFCIRCKNFRALSRATGRALQLHPRQQELWLIAAYIEKEVKKDLDGCRSILQKAVGMNTECGKLWQEYFKFECQMCASSEDEEVKNGNVAKVVFSHAVKNIHNINRQVFRDIAEEYKAPECVISIIDE